MNFNQSVWIKPCKHRETRYHCMKCNVALCDAPCFSNYHTQKTSDTVFSLYFLQISGFILYVSHYEKVFTEGTCVSFLNIVIQILENIYAVFWSISGKTDLSKCYTQGLMKNN